MIVICSLGQRCRRATTPRSTCNCSCRGVNHGTLAPRRAPKRPKKKSSSTIARQRVVAAPQVAPHAYVHSEPDELADEYYQETP